MPTLPGNPDPLPTQSPTDTVARKSPKQPSGALGWINAGMLRNTYVANLDASIFFKQLK